MKEMKSRPKTQIDDKSNLASLETIKNIPSYIEQVNINIQNIDHMINQKKVRSSLNVIQECNDLQNLVKQSVEGLTDIINSKITKSTLNTHSSCRTFGKSFEVIEEEIIIQNNIKKNLINNSKRIKLTENKKMNNVGNTSQISLKNQKSQNNQDSFTDLRNNTKEASKKLDKNLKILKDKLSNKITKPTLKREKSMNRRYENEEKIKMTSKSPMPVMKSYQLKPKRSLAENSVNISSREDSKGKQEFYFTENKVSTDDRSGLLTSRNINSFNIETNTTISHNDNDISVENINSFIQMFLLFNDYGNCRIKDFNNKLVSDDLSKLLISLLEVSDGNDIQLGFDKSVVNHIKNGLKNKRDEKKYNSSSLNINLVIKIQRKWRNYTIRKLLQSDDDSKIKEKLKSHLLNSFMQNDQFKKTFIGINNLLSQFHLIFQKNKSNSFII
jgi:hypothetical protein